MSAMKRLLCRPLCRMCRQRHLFLQALQGGRYYAVGLKQVSNLKRSAPCCVVQVAVDVPAAAALLAALPAGGHMAAARAVIEALAVPRGGSHPPAALWPVLIAACREVQEWRRALDLALVHLYAKYASNRNMHMCCSVMGAYCRGICGANPW